MHAYGAYGAGLIFLIVVMPFSVSALADLQTMITGNACQTMRITDQALKSKFLEHVKVKRLNTDILSLFAYYFMCPEGGNQEVHARDALELMGSFTKADRQYVTSFVKLVQDLPNRAEITKKAHDFADMYWWSDFVQTPIGIFDRSKVIGSLVEHYRYRYSWHAFKDWYRKKPNNEASFICGEEAIMAFLKFEAERHMPFDTKEGLHEAFEIICANNVVNWNEVLQHDDLKSAGERVVVAYLKGSQQLHLRWPDRFMMEWSLKAMAHHVAQCPDEKCVTWLTKVFEEVSNFFRLAPSCLGRLKREAGKKAVDWTNMLNFFLFFSMDTNPKVKECDQGFIDFLVEAYDIQKNKLIWEIPTYGRFSDTKATDPMILGVMAKHKKYMTWTFAQAKILLVALKEAKLCSVDLYRYFSLEHSTDFDWHHTLIRVYLATGKNKEYFLNMCTRRDNYKEIVDLGTTKTAKTDLALSVYFTDREKTVCKPETMKAIVDLDVGGFTERMYERMIRDVCGHGSEHEEKARKIIEDGTKSRTMLFKIQYQLDDLKKKTLAPAAANAK